MTKSTSLGLTAIIGMTIVAGASEAHSQGGARLTYPPTRAADQVDVYHGTSVSDPYRWLEETDSPETRAWIDAQNALTFGYLGAVQERGAIRERLTALWNHPRYSAPVKLRGTYFHLENTGLQNQAVMYVSESLRGRSRMLLDPNTFSSDGTVSLGTWEPSPDARYLAYSISSGGSDWQELRVRDVRSGRDLVDTLKWVKFSGISWTRDNRGFFYSRYDEPQAGAELTGVVRNQKLYYHRVGTPQSSDILVYERPDEPDWGFDVTVTDDGVFAIIHVWHGTDPRNRVYLIDLGVMGAPRVTGPIFRLIDEPDAEYRFVHNEGSSLYFRTTHEAPRGKIVRIDVVQPRRENWITVVRESEHALQSAEAVDDRIVLHYLEDAHSLLRFYSLRGAPMGSVTLPGPGTVTQINGRPGEREMFYTFTSYLAAPTVYRYDVRRDRQDIHRAPEVDFPADQFETTQIFATSKDGTRIPMFVTARKGMARDGNTPLLLYGYGGFNVSLTPEFSPATLAWLERGGIYVVANLRGGGEYGVAWHHAGTLERKQNVFDDFIAAAEHLIAEKYTSPARLAISGGSNGGLLVGAAMTQRPELFAAALPAVGVMDMLRFHKFTIGWAWTSDYGSSDEPEQFPFLHAYSPLHNLKPGTRYPATLITTADHDDRVVPGHSFKFAAALQAAQGGDAPVLIRIETRAGHGAGKPTSMRIEEAADKLAFLVRTLGMEQRTH